MNLLKQELPNVVMLDIKKGIYTHSIILYILKLFIIPENEYDFFINSERYKYYFLTTQPLKYSYIKSVTTLDNMISSLEKGNLFFDTLEEIEDFNNSCCQISLYCIHYLLEAVYKFESSFKRDIVVDSILNRLREENKMSLADGYLTQRIWFIEYKSVLEIFSKIDNIKLSENGVLVAKKLFETSGPNIPNEFIMALENEDLISMFAEHAKCSLEFLNYHANLIIKKDYLDKVFKNQNISGYDKYLFVFENKIKRPYMSFIPTYSRIAQDELKLAYEHPKSKLTVSDIIAQYGDLLWDEFLLDNISKIIKLKIWDTVMIISDSFLNKLTKCEKNKKYIKPFFERIIKKRILIDCSKETLELLKEHIDIKILIKIINYSKNKIDIKEYEQYLDLNDSYDLNFIYHKHRIISLELFKKLLLYYLDKQSSHLELLVKREDIPFDFVLSHIDKIGSRVPLLLRANKVMTEQEKKEILNIYEIIK